MPVWHEGTRAWRESGELAVVGLVQEQHPDRARLFAQWYGIDWPILWDPFNVTGATAVPLYRTIDEHGVVRSLKPRLEGLAEDFLGVDFEAPAEPGPAAGSARALVQVDRHRAGTAEWAYWQALSDLIWAGPQASSSALKTLASFARMAPRDGAAQFRLGVALRMRHDSPHRGRGDFQAALDQWNRALELEPNQYIWRRRIQQYGPRLDKPYPFYDWVGEARAAIEGRGEEPVALAAELTGAERAARSRSFESEGAAAAEPDPEGRVARAPEGHFALESAVAFDTSRKSPTARVHLLLRPAEGSDAYWNNESDPLQVWIGGAELPAGWAADRRLVLHGGAPGAATSREERRIEFELRLPEGTRGRQRLPGYALFNACQGEDGVCRYLRQDFEVSFSVP